MKTKDENDFLKAIEDSYKSVAEKIDRFIEQSKDNRETKIWLDNLKKADDLFEALLKEKTDAVKRLIKGHK